MLDFLYVNKLSDREPFQEYWCGPERLQHATEALVARYESSDDSDGQTVEVYCEAWPARFYTLKVQAGQNSVGKPMPAYILATGSGAASLAAAMAKAISEGMLILRTP